MADALLAFDSVGVAYGGVPALRDVRASVGAGAVLGVVGESGSGKSTLLHAATGFASAARATVSGRVLLDGEDVARMPPSRLRGLLGARMALVPQDCLAALAPVRTVGEQFVELARAHADRWSEVAAQADGEAEARRRAADEGGQALRRASDETGEGAAPSRLAGGCRRANGRRLVQRDAVLRRAEGLLESLNVADAAAVLRSYPFELSGGIGQRVGIALALLLKPELLLLDEPTSALDAVSAARVLQALSRLKHDAGVAMVLVTHNMAVARRLADDVVVLHDGAVVERGPAREVLSRPRHARTRALLEAVPVLRGSAPSAQVASGPAPSGRDAAKARAKAPVPAPAADPRADAGGIPAPQGEKRPPVLEVRSVSKGFQRAGGARRVAVEGVSLSIEPGEFVGLVGESGSGKSTLARIVLLLAAPDAGSVLVGGRDVTGARGSELRAVHRSVQAVFQSPAASFDPRRTLGYSVAEPLRNLGVSKREAIQRAGELMAACGLPDEAMSRFPRQVSGGQCQRAAIARALAVEPDLLVCDEATSALDVTVQRRIMELLLRQCRRRGMAALFISHDIALVGSVCTKLAVMHQGRIVEAGRTEQVVGDPQSPRTRALLDAVL